MSDIPLAALSLALLFLILLSAFFSGTETGMMALNRYRLRHLARHKHRGALRASKLLERPDRLIYGDGDDPIVVLGRLNDRLATAAAP